MPRPTTTRVEFESLPEFLRSPAVGRVIAEALDDDRTGGEIRTAAVAEMVADAAREVRDFHGLPLPSHQQGTAPRIAVHHDEHAEGA